MPKVSSKSCQITRVIEARNNFATRLRRNMVYHRIPPDEAMLRVVLRFFPENLQGHDLFDEESDEDEDDLDLDDLVVVPPWYVDPIERELQEPLGLVPRPEVLAPLIIPRPLPPLEHQGPLIIPRPLPPPEHQRPLVLPRPPPPPPSPPPQNNVPIENLPNPIVDEVFEANPERDLNGDQIQNVEINPNDLSK